jgi:hypothetical protein
MFFPQKFDATDPEHAQLRGIAANGAQFEKRVILQALHGEKSVPLPDRAFGLQEISLSGVHQSRSPPSKISTITG